MSHRKEQIKKHLDESRAFLNDVLDQVGDRWEVPIYSDGLQWTVRQIVAHLVDADQGHNMQVMNIAEGRDIIPEDFDIERYNGSRTRKNAEKTVEQSRSELEKSRSELLDWLFLADESKLDNRGRHASLKIMSVEEIIQNTGNHERLHAGDIAQVLEITVNQV